MEHLTADEIRPQEVPADITSPDPDLDRALARAIRRLIAGARGRDPIPEPAGLKPDSVIHPKGTKPAIVNRPADAS